MEQVIPEGNTFDDLIKSISAPATSYFDQMIAELCRTTTPAFTTSTTPEPRAGNPVSTPRQQDTDEIWLRDTFILRSAPKESTTAGDLLEVTQILEYRRPDNQHYAAMIGACMQHLQKHKHIPTALVIHSTEIAAYTGAIASYEGMYSGVIHYWDSPVRLITEKDVPEWVRVLLDASIIPVGMIFSAA